MLKHVVAGVATRAKRVGFFFRFGSGRVRVLEKISGSGRVWVRVWVLAPYIWSIGYYRVMKILIRYFREYLCFYQIFMFLSGIFGNIYVFDIMLYIWMVIKYKNLLHLFCSIFWEGDAKVKQLCRILLFVKVKALLDCFFISFLWSFANSPSSVALKLLCKRFPYFR